MADFIRDLNGDEVEAPVRNDNRYFKSVNFHWTASGSGAVDLTTPVVVPDDHPWWAYWFEVDTTNINPSADFALYLEWPAGHLYQGHSYLISSWTGGGAEHHPIQPNTAVPVPAGAILRLTISAVLATTHVDIHGLIQWV